jgi:oligopeptide transport system ATP-binding protein
MNNSNALYSTETAPSTPLVQVNDLVKHFPVTSGLIFEHQVGAVRAVDGISLEIARGEPPDAPS